MGDRVDARGLWLVTAKKEVAMRNCVLLTLAALIALAVPAGAQMYLELGIAPIRFDIPPNGSEWHELHPNFCVVHPQEGYIDNGDGVVSVCDNIVIGGIIYHIDWAGPTYYMVDVSNGEPWFVEPEDPQTSGDPTGEMWHVVAGPEFCTMYPVDGWEDNGDGEVSGCDIVIVAGRTWHIEEVRLDITITEAGSPVQASTWSKLKSFFGF